MDTTGATFGTNWWPLVPELVTDRSPNTSRPTLKIFWFAVYQPTHHFTPDPIICFGHFWKKNKIPTYLPRVGKQQTNKFLRLALQI